MTDEPGEFDLAAQVEDRVGDAMGLLMHDIFKRRNVSNYPPPMEDFVHFVFNTAFFLGTQYSQDYKDQSGRLMSLLWGIGVMDKKEDYSTALDIFVLDVSDNVLPQKKKTTNEIIKSLTKVKNRAPDPVLDVRHPDGPLAPVWEDDEMTWEQKTLAGGSQAWLMGDYPEGWDE